MTYSATTDAHNRPIVLDGATPVGVFKTAAEAEAEAKALNAADSDLRAARRDVFSTDPAIEAAAVIRIDAAKARLTKAWAARAAYVKSKLDDAFRFRTE